MSDAVFVRCDGDWCHRQPVLIDGADLFVFPFRASRSHVQKLCDERIQVPSGGRVIATPWPSAGDRCLAVLACASFPKIRSEDPEDAKKGFISERDVAVFVPVKLTVDGVDRGIHLLNPFLWVDNPAGVIMGREIFGFPKILGRIAWHAPDVVFSVESLVFREYDPNKPATEETVLAVKQSGTAGLMTKLLGKTLAEEVADTTENITQNLIESVLDTLGIELGELVTDVTGFDRLRLVFLKQFRSAAETGGDPVCYQEVVGAQFEFRAAPDVHPVATLFGRDLVVEPYASLRLADTLGIETRQHLPVCVHVTVDLRLTGQEI